MATKPEPSAMTDHDVPQFDHAARFPRSTLSKAQHAEIAANLLPVLKPIVEQLRALKQTNQELQTRLLEVEATLAARERLVEQR
jgi:hypothetical protein